MTGRVVPRSPATVNPKLPTGEIELQVETLVVQSAADVLPIQVAGDQTYPEELRLRYRFLDLRRERLQRNMILRAQVIDSIRRRMIAAGFNEFQTPILTASSPEGARDFLVPARLHPGKFYALPQAPQQFKQLCMVAGFDRYFQIAPCFRDEAGRADRTLMFYQLDVEMSFVTQEDVFAAMEPVMHGVFAEFADGPRGGRVAVPPHPATRRRCCDYGTDKPDLRNPLVIRDVTAQFAGSGFGLFARIAAAGGVVRAIPAPGRGGPAARLLRQAERVGARAGRRRARLHRLRRGRREGPDRQEPRSRTGSRRSAPPAASSPATPCSSPPASRTRRRNSPAWSAPGSANELGLIEQDAFRFCWIVDFPMYELNEETEQDRLQPQPVQHAAGRAGGAEHAGPADASAPTSTTSSATATRWRAAPSATTSRRSCCAPSRSPAIRRGAVEEQFGGMLNAFRYGAPPHGGMAAGIDRIVMLLADEPNLREVNLFPMNQQGEDLMMGAPSAVTPARLKELSIAVVMPPKVVKSAT